MSTDTTPTPKAPTAPPKGPESTPPRIPAALSRLGEIIIEMGDDRNRRFLYPPTAQELRGWWKKSNLLGVTMDQRMTQMPDLPGLYICLDCRRGRLRILDPLNAPENKGLLAQAQAVHKDVFRQTAGPETDKVEEGLNETRIKTNLYWIRRLLDSGSARLVSGDCPTLEEIETLPGMTRTEAWNSSARARKYREEPEEDVAGRNQASRVW